MSSQGNKTNAKVHRDDSQGGKRPSNTATQIKSSQAKGKGPSTALKGKDPANKPSSTRHSAAEPTKTANGAAEHEPESSQKSSARDPPSPVDVAVDDPTSQATDDASVHSGSASARSAKVAPPRRPQTHAEWIAMLERLELEDRQKRGLSYDGLQQFRSILRDEEHARLNCLQAWEDGMQWLKRAERLHWRHQLHQRQTQQMQQRVRGLERDERYQRSSRTAAYALQLGWLRELEPLYHRLHDLASQVSNDRAAQELHVERQQRWQQVFTAVTKQEVEEQLLQNGQNLREELQEMWEACHKTISSFHDAFGSDIAQERDSLLELRRKMEEQQRVFVESYQPLVETAESMRRWMCDMLSREREATAEKRQEVERLYTQLSLPQAAVASSLPSPPQEASQAPSEHEPRGASGEAARQDDAPAHRPPHKHDASSRSPDGAEASSEGSTRNRPAVPEPCPEPPTLLPPTSLQSELSEPETQDERQDERQQHDREPSIGEQQTVLNDTNEDQVRPVETPPVPSMQQSREFPFQHGHRGPWQPHSRGSRPYHHHHHQRQHHEQWLQQPWRPWHSAPRHVAPRQAEGPTADEDPPAGSPPATLSSPPVQLRLRRGRADRG